MQLLADVVDTVLLLPLLLLLLLFTRPYDVGDRVYHWLPENSKMQSSIVMKIDLLCTKFKSWDEKVIYYVLTFCTMFSNDIHCILTVISKQASLANHIARRTQRVKRAQLLQ
jgi:hypothetical protein